MRSRDKMQVTCTPIPRYGNKMWVYVDFINQDGKTIYTWVPSFEDHFRIVQAICYCEDKKYPPTEGYKGRQAVVEFLVDACELDAQWEDISSKHKLPPRTRDEKGT